MTTFSFLKRVFLNPVSTLRTSYILAHVQDSHDGTERHGANLIVMADCDRKIEIEFFLGSNVHRRRSLAKINLLIKVFTAFRDALLKEMALIEKTK